MKTRLYIQTYIVGNINKTRCGLSIFEGTRMRFPFERMKLFSENYISYVGLKCNVLRLRALRFIEGFHIRIANFGGFPNILFD